MVSKSAEMILKIFKERILGVKFSYLIVSLCLQRITADNLKDNCFFTFLVYQKMCNYLVVLLQIL